MTSHRRPGPTGAIRPTVRALAFLGLGLLLLYYLVTQSLTTRELVQDLAEAKAQTIAARETSSEERQALAEQVTQLQEDLQIAQDAVDILTQQLTDAGLVPALPPEAP